MKVFASSKDRHFLTENLSMLVASGMPVVAAVHSIAEDVRSSAIKKKLGAVAIDLDEGYPLWKALSRSDLFPDYTISLIRISEESGRLSENLKLVAAQESKNRLFRQRIQSAMMYPVFILIITMGIGVGISWFILPRLATVFRQLALEVPTITQALIWLGEYLDEHGLIVVPSFIFVFLLIIYFVFVFKKTRFIGQAILFKIPPIKKLLQQVEIARMSYLLGSLLDAGVPIIDTLGSLERATSFRMYKKLYSHLLLSIEEGNSFEKSFASYKKTNKLIPTPVQQMIAAGERSGNLPGTFMKINASYEEKSEVTTKNLTTILEPVLLVIVWVGVVGVALAVILPIYSLIGGLNEVTTSATTGNRSSNNEAGVIEEVLVPEQLSGPRLEIISEVNIRDDSSIDGAIIGEAVSGEVYEFVNFFEGWYEIVLPRDQFGWVNEDFVNVLEDESE